MVVLRTLWAGPLRGFAILERIKEASRGGLDIEDGSLYPVLNRMLSKGLLKAEWGIHEYNRKVRFYGLTAAGRTQLEREVREFDELVKSIQLVMRSLE